jgi:hypothetical protein|uniref:Uncharacterized protein n=1 Tax=Eutreptiella gymnastica TaxID=73025 RepID=A0A7S4FV09_9EUGL|mmetsp:Transcript_8975/g.13746  ORF Transcript_8975/g.13746 Transcript_8975/m.13746 type:complete len:122 (+) Transcript_8975:2025-2390(+)
MTETALASNMASNTALTRHQGFTLHFLNTSAELAKTAEKPVAMAVMILTRADKPNQCAELDQPIFENRVAVVLLVSVGDQRFFPSQQMPNQFSCRREKITLRKRLPCVCLPLQLAAWFPTN